MSPSSPSLVELKPNSPGIRLENDTHVCEIHAHGAHVTSWRRKSDGQEMIFTSEAAVFDTKKAIRGGIPICFPQFSDMGPCETSHGFARNCAWDVRATNGATRVTFGLGTEDARRARLDAMCGFEGEFDVEYEVVLDGSELLTTMRVRNTSCADVLSFTTALHTYFRVGDCEKASVSGLCGNAYLDNLDARMKKVDGADEVRFRGEVDRIYTDTATNILTLKDPALKRVFTIEKSTTLPDAVVWNPWIDKARAMGDFGDEEYKDMVCVEAANVTGVRLNAGETWEASQRIACVEDSS